MLNTVKKSAAAYHGLYEGKMLVLKLQDEHLEADERFTKLQNEIRALLAKNISFTLLQNHSDTEHVVTPLASLVDEVIFLTDQGVINNTAGSRIPLLSLEDLKAVQGKKHPHAHTEKLELLNEIISIVQIVGKAVITTLDGLQKEIEYWRGSGTLIYDPKQTHFSEATKNEKIIFDDIFAEHVAQGAFRPRSQEEIETLKDHLYILRVKNSPLGGLCLISHEDKWNELSSLWAGQIGGGIGKTLVEYAKTKSQGKKLYALSTQGDAIRLFRRSGLQEIGKVSDIKSNFEIDLPEKVRRYNTSQRNPHIFIDPNS